MRNGLSLDMTSLDSLPSDIMTLLCAQLPRASVVHLLFHVSAALARRDWGRVLSVLPGFREVMALRGTDEDVRSFLRSLMSLEAFRGQTFLDNTETDKHDAVPSFPSRHRAFVQFSLVARAPAVYCRVFGAK